MIKLFDDDDTPATASPDRKPEPGSPESLLRNGNHVAAALGALKRGNRLNNWERDFATSMVHARGLTYKQAEKLALVCAKANLPTPRPPSRRRRRSRQ